jgi:hypothetical protein
VSKESKWSANTITLPLRDLKRNDVNNEEEFDVFRDAFRDKRVWRIENGQWVKDTIWGEPATYGSVHRAKAKPRTLPRKLCDAWKS